MKNTFGGINAPTEMVAKKLTQIASLSPALAGYLIQAMRLYEWRLVNVDLAYTPDEDGAISTESQQMLQLAIRRDSKIMIARNLWSRLNPVNQTALIFHEMLYTMVKPVEGDNGYFQPSVRIRELTAYLFEQNLTLNGEKELIKRTLDALEIIAHENESFAFPNEIYFPKESPDAKNWAFFQPSISVSLSYYYKGRDHFFNNSGTNLVSIETPDLCGPNSTSCVQSWQAAVAGKPTNAEPMDAFTYDQISEFFLTPTDYQTSSGSSDKWLKVDHGSYPNLMGSSLLNDLPGDQAISTLTANVKKCKLYINNVLNQEIPSYKP